MIGLLGLAFAFAYPSQYYGVDVSEPTDQNTWNCLLNQNLTFAIVRAYQSLGHPDPNAPATLQAAAAAGVHASAYIFPCPLCSGANGTKQVTDTINFLNNNNAPFDTLWFDIEGAMYWHSAHSANFQFLKDMIRGAENADIDFGIYCNWYTWSSLFGAYSLNNPPKLWYPHYDGKPDFSDFKPFGGFTKPLIKQFSDKGAKCHANGYDINWSPQNI